MANANHAEIVMTYWREQLTMRHTVEISRSQAITEIREAGYPNPSLEIDTSSRDRPVGTYIFCYWQQPEIAA